MIEFLLGAAVGAGAVIIWALRQARKGEDR